MKKIVDNLEHLEKTATSEFEKAVARPRKALERFPTLFLLLATAGAVLVFFGFERLFDSLPILRDNPLVMIVIGLGLLIFTGRLYKKLDA